MLRNIVRTSHCLVRRRINTLPPAFLHFSCSAFTIEIERNLHSIRQFTTPSHSSLSSGLVEPAVFEEICNETLESLCDYFEEIVDQAPNLKGADVTYSDGVLTVSLGSQYGTYVINRQTPNKQIWLSSPVSGPKRYDIVLKDGGYWVYKHDGVPLHRLLQEEISKIVPNKVDFGKCLHSLT